MYSSCREVLGGLGSSWSVGGGVRPSERSPKAVGQGVSSDLAVAVPKIALA